MSSTRRATKRISLLLALSPGTMSSLLFSPPLSADSRLSRRKRDFGFSGPWQRKQTDSKIGFTSRSKSTVALAAAGKALASISEPRKCNSTGGNNVARKMLQLILKSLLGLAAHWDHERFRIPLNRPSGTFCPTGGEGWDEGVRLMEREFIGSFRSGAAQ